MFEIFIVCSFKYWNCAGKVFQNFEILEILQFGIWNLVRLRLVRFGEKIKVIFLS
jgi:hypothetical protein